jgi:hypothetical protein
MTFESRLSGCSIMGLDLMFTGVTSNDNMQATDRRYHGRQRTFLHGKLLFYTNSFTSDCVMKNLSNAGAKIFAKGQSFLPDNPIVLITRSGMAHDARTVWRASDEFGVEFQSSHDLNERAPTRLTHAYRLWIENLPR